jgi:transposase
MGNYPTSGKDHLPIPGRNAYEKTIRENFGTTRAELKRFRNWLVANKCEQVAFEATGVYWMPIYDALSKTIDTIVANPLQISTRKWSE